MNGLKQKLEEVKKEKILVYRVLDLALDTARANEEFQVSGSYLYVLGFDGTDFNIRFNEISNPLFPLRQHRGLSMPFHRIFITHTAQATKTIKLFFGITPDVLIQDWS
jgi:hypothetical protein